QHRHFAERCQSENKPPRNPRAEILIDVIALKNEEKNQKNDERRRFEESDAEQALVHQHDTLPPALYCCRRETRTPGSLAAEGAKPSTKVPPTLTCYFLNGQGHLFPTVLSRIMAVGANTRG